MGPHAGALRTLSGEGENQHEGDGSHRRRAEDPQCDMPALPPSQSSDHFVPLVRSGETSGWSLLVVAGYQPETRWDPGGNLAPLRVDESACLRAREPAWSPRVRGRGPARGQGRDAALKHLEPGGVRGWAGCRCVGRRGSRGSVVVVVVDVGMVVVVVLSGRIRRGGGRGRRHGQPLRRASSWSSSWSTRSSWSPTGRGLVVVASATSRARGRRGGVEPAAGSGVERGHDVGVRAGASLLQRRHVGDQAHEGIALGVGRDEGRLR